MNKIKRFLTGRVRGFSLIEISMALLVVGVIVGASMKGWGLVETAQVKSVVSDIEILQKSYTEYKTLYGADNIDANSLFSKLYEKRLIDSENFKLPKIGGQYKPITENNSIKIELSKNNAAFITEKQLNTLKSSCIEVFGENNNKINETKQDDLYIVKFILD